MLDLDIGEKVYNFVATFRMAHNCCCCFLNWIQIKLTLKIYIIIEYIIIKKIMCGHVHSFISKKNTANSHIWIWIFYLNKFLSSTHMHEFLFLNFSNHFENYISMDTSLRKCLLFWKKGKPCDKEKNSATANEMTRGPYFTNNYISMGTSLRKCLLFLYTILLIINFNP